VVSIFKGAEMEETGQNVGQENRHASKLPSRKYGYFRDDQILFLVAHSANAGEEATKFQNVAGGIGNKLRGLRSGPIRNLSSVISLPALTEEEIEQSKDLLSPEELETVKGPLSIIKCDLEQEPGDPANLLETVKELNNPDTQDSPALIAESGFGIQGVSPNWLVSVASQGAGTGGPGGRPSPYYGSRKNAPYHFDLVTKLKNKEIYGDGEGVDVVILDTAPCAQDLVAAYKEWPDHPLIPTLLGPEGKLHLYPASYEELLRLSCTSLNDHDYKMTDHGLFIAGIIHSIVPKAEIHLIEVLNQFGVGDLTSFLYGLQKIYTENIYQRHRKLVINCSWMLEFPLDDLHSRHMDQVEDPDAEFEGAVRAFSKTDQATLVQLEALFCRFYGLGRQAIAAVGNDGRVGDETRVRARYPAALRRVTGVGALPKSLEKLPTDKYRTSVFSNLSESPDGRGVVTKGIVTLGGEEGPGNGVLGLYIGAFPDNSVNESKWAWWAGTSFATPILTGAVASLLSRPGNNINTTQDAITKLYAPGVKFIIDAGAGTQEDALPVKQN
jgi:hypothetical protein